jgi:putative ABC transport system permease protein
VRELATDLPMFNVRSMEEWLSQSAAQPRLNASLVAAFGCLALLIAAIGVHGVLLYLVSQRTREIGLRMALGAQRSQVMRLVLRQGMMVALAGIGIGLLIAFLLSGALASLLYGIAAHDPLTFAAVALILAAVAAGSCIAPALRASKVDPIMALRCE